MQTCKLRRIQKFPTNHQFSFWKYFFPSTIRFGWTLLYLIHLSSGLVFMVSLSRIATPSYSSFCTWYHHNGTFFSIVSRPLFISSPDLHKPCHFLLINHHHFNFARTRDGWTDHHSTPQYVQYINERELVVWFSTTPAGLKGLCGRGGMILPHEWRSHECRQNHTTPTAKPF